MAKKVASHPKAKPAPNSDLPPALQDGPNKSAAIKAYFVDHPQAKNAEVIEALKGQGIEVSTNYVSIIKSKAKTKTGKKRGPKPGSKESTRRAAMVTATRTSTSRLLPTSSKRQAVSLKPPRL